VVENTKAEVKKTIRKDFRAVMSRLETKLTAEKPAEIKIKDYIIQNASDELTNKILNGSKNIRDCIAYIAGQVRSKAIGQCYVGTDEEIYGMAIHYFEEDEIEQEQVSGGYTVSTASNTKEEKKPKVEAKPKPKKKEEPEQRGFEQISLFDL